MCGKVIPEAKCWQASCALLHVQRLQRANAVDVLAYNAVLGATGPAEASSLAASWRWSMHVFDDLLWDPAVSADIISLRLRGMDLACG